MTRVSLCDDCKCVVIRETYPGTPDIVRDRDHDERNWVAETLLAYNLKTPVACLNPGGTHFCLAAPVSPSEIDLSNLKVPVWWAKWIERSDRPRRVRALPRKDRECGEGEGRA